MGLKQCVVVQPYVEAKRVKAEIETLKGDAKELLGTSRSAQYPPTARGGGGDGGKRGPSSAGDLDAENLHFGIDNMSLF